MGRTHAAPRAGFLKEIVGNRGTLAGTRRQETNRTQSDPATVQLLAVPMLSLFSSTAGDLSLLTLSSRVAGRRYRFRAIRFHLIPLLLGQA